MFTDVHFFSVDACTMVSESKTRKTCGCEQGRRMHRTTGIIATCHTIMPTAVATQYFRSFEFRCDFACKVAANFRGRCCIACCSPHAACLSHVVVACCMCVVCISSQSIVLTSTSRHRSMIEAASMRMSDYCHAICKSLR